MMQLPGFLALHFRGGVVSCPQCNGRIRPRDVTGYGVRDADSTWVTVFVLVQCPRCQFDFGYDVRVMPKPIFLGWLQRMYAEKELKPPPEPSVRPGTPARPIGADEARRMIGQIGRVSFKRSTKSWQEFIKRLSAKPPRRRGRRRKK